jgi:hypothetical protein
MSAPGKRRGGRTSAATRAGSTCGRNTCSSPACRIRARRSRCARWALDPRTRFWIADLKGVGDWGAFRDIADAGRFVEGPTDEHVAQATEMVEAAVAEMERRIAEGVTEPRLFVVVDEAQQAFMCPALDEQRRPYGGTKATSRYFNAVRKLHNQGRAVNVVLWQGTQDPTDQNLPKQIAARAVARRGRRGSPAAELPVRRDLLADVVEVLGDEPRVRTTVVLQRLAELDTDAYEGMSHAQLAAALLADGVAVAKSNGQSVIRASDTRRPWTPARGRPRGRRRGRETGPTAARSGAAQRFPDEGFHRSPRGSNPGKPLGIVPRRDGRFPDRFPGGRSWLNSSRSRSRWRCSPAPGAQRVRDYPLGGTVLELGLAAVIAWAATSRGWVPAGDGFLPTAVVAWGVVYVVSCRVWPFRRCWWPWCTRRRPRTGPGGGIYRVKRPCSICGGQDLPRLGARLMRAGRDDDD